MLAIFAGIAVLTLVVLIHELGHFLAARWCGVPVTEFCLGFPGTPKVVTLGRWQGTEFTIRLLPLGGFVSFPAPSEPEIDPLREYPPGHRALIMAAGSLVNLATGLLVITLGSMLFRGESFPVAAGTALKGLMIMAAGLWEAMGMLVTGAGLPDLTGPVGMVDMTAKATAHGAKGVLFLVGILNLGLGLSNLLPLLPLDGGRLLLLALERLAGRELPTRVGTWITVVGTTGLLMLMACATWHDVARLGS